jgi:hypothetical protein
MTCKMANIDPENANETYETRAGGVYRATDEVRSGSPPSHRLVKWLKKRKQSDVS